jgi:hypothetical protein
MFDERIKQKNRPEVGYEVSAKSGIMPVRIAPDTIRATALREFLIADGGPVHLKTIYSHFGITTPQEKKKISTSLSDQCKKGSLIRTGPSTIRQFLPYRNSP